MSAVKISSLIFLIGFSVWLGADLARDKPLWAIAIDVFVISVHFAILASIKK